MASCRAARMMILMYKADLHLHYGVCSKFMAMPFEDTSFDDAHSSKVIYHMCSSLVA
jgi:hypothetical protein